MEFLAIRISQDRNYRIDPVISPDWNPITFRVIKTNEELMIAKQSRRLRLKGSVDQRHEGF